MQASLARWAIVSCSLVGMLGCASSPKPSWWPGRKPTYSNSSATPPQLPPPQYGQQQPGYDPAANGFGANGQNPAAGQQYANNGYPQGASGYPPAGAGGYSQGTYNPQDYASGQASGGQPGYDPSYAQSSGGYADPSYSTNNPYATAGQQPDYQGTQQAQGYPGQATGGYQPTTVNNQYVTGGAGAGGAAGGMVADSRYAAGAGGAAAGGGYPTDSRYDAQSAGQGTAWGGGAGAGAAAGGAAADPWQGGAAGSSTYPSSTSGYPDAGTQQDPHYRPGGTGDYSTPTGAAGASNAWGQPSAGGAGANYNATSATYPSTAAGSGAYNGGFGATGQQVDRYGQPISGAAR